MITADRDYVLTGWNAIKSRVDQLNLHLTDDQVKEVTNKIKKLGDVRQLNIDDVDSIIKDFHAEQSTTNTPLLKPVEDDEGPEIKKQKV
ncbi:hypothetical protein FOB64_005045 [Candida albicans]|uniref:2-isopropylmalate synthase/homocitrate synthase post-catalytic domain-containing protein n=1 Tax=Candida albicans TaxID=5476 RepID=A0A8H6BUN3_CANAX|nr:hypothetical protein FOB64_005045 [Candida albicans]